MEQALLLSALDKDGNMQIEIEEFLIIVDLMRLKIIEEVSYSAYSSCPSSFKVFICFDYFVFYRLKMRIICRESYLLW